MILSQCYYLVSVHTNANLFFDSNKNRKLAKTRPSLHFYAMIFWWKKGLCIGMAMLPFQKLTSVVQY